MLICQSIPRLASTLALGILCLSTSVAAELKLADRPLLASNNVPPNILVAVDDSGSMDWETPVMLAMVAVGAMAMVLLLRMPCC